MVSVSFSGGGRLFAPASPSCFGSARSFVWNGGAPFWNVDARSNASIPQSNNRFFPCLRISARCFQDGRRGPRGEGKGRGKRRPGKDARHAAGPPRHRDDRGGGARDEGRDPDRILQHAFARSGWWRDFNCGELALASWLIPFVVNSIVTHPFSCPDRMRGVCFVHVLFYHQTYLPYGRMAEISRPVLLGFHVWAPHPGICPHHRKLVVVLRISGGRRHPAGRRGVLGPGLRSYSFCNPFPFNLQATYFLTPVTPFNPVINLSSPELCCRVL